MTQVSTNLTLFLKIFFPTMWMVFFGALAIGIWAVDFEYVGGFPGEIFRIAVTVFFLFGTALLYFTLMNLKRVEMDAEGIYVTNYFKHYRYPYSNVERLRERDFLIVKTLTIELKKAGHFGKKITFIPSSSRLDGFLHQHPEIASTFLKMTENGQNS